MIDKHYYRANLAIYYGDFLGSLLLLLISFALCLQVEGALFLLPFGCSVIFLYRGGAFIHELTHQARNPRLRAFYVLWNLTIGALTLVAGARFIKPHVLHHQTGIFRTRLDPQYPLLREDPLRALFILVAIPFIMPLYSLLLVVTSSVRYWGVEEAVERYLVSKGNPTGGELTDEYREEVVWYGRYYLLLFVLYAWWIPQTLPLVYAIQVGGWMLTTFRIPMEHGLRTLKDSSVEADQMEDSFTVESPLAAILQPLGLRFHTAHHMYPGVPYHKLRALHAELKRTRPGYAEKVVPFWRAFLQGPCRAAPAPKAVVAD